MKNNTTKKNGIKISIKKTKQKEKSQQKIKPQPQPHNDLKPIELSLKTLYTHWYKKRTEFNLKSYKKQQP